MSGVPEIAADAAIDAVSAGAWLLDVREQSEWDEVHAPSAHLIPMGTLGEHIDELPDEHRILVVCHSGGRSARVTAALVDAGYPAVNVAGGMVAWEAAGGPVERTGGTAARP